MNKGPSSMGREVYATDYKVGQDNVQFLGLDVHNPVFGITAFIIFAFVIGSIAFPENARDILMTARGWSIDNFDWFFMISGNIFVLFCLAFIFLPMGKIRLGGTNARPEHSTYAWFCMLFAAGMGIGLMFWSVAEPVAYYTGWYGTPLNVEARTPEAESLAMGATMFHWGLHPWAIYAVVALALAFFSYNKGLPLTMRSAFYPLFGERVWGVLGHFVDILAVIATIFGLATSLGFGAQQATSGLNFLFGVPNTLISQIVVIAVVTGVTMISVARGLEGGVKILSNLNMIIAALLAAFVLIVGHTGALFGVMATTIVGYVENIIPLSNMVGRDDQTFYHGWTVFYWAWWISWSPFVGMFIARVSRGRTVREFVIAVLLVPTVISIFWMSIFGGSAIEQVQQGTGALSDGIGEVSLAMFQMFEQLPLTSIISLISIILVLVFFVTSADSGSLVIDGITAGGKTDAPVTQRIFWAVLEGIIAVALLVGGGSEALTAIQAAAITIGLPFTLLMLIMCLGLYKGLKSDLKFVQ
ncbi:Glycine betaine transporter OpuD [Marinomonas aquimarina]|uniref:Glycine betaine transporter OpuD n=1 Tax=Marinomonas aquimarina TaxID=295068 RepID=A0A1A8TPH0_9GAMM|nr:BCCT family transporter [Marinomonas aquimarina]SBS35810.1 Glycine betaine transporter OpuD [Marinomonas aquimarina]